MRSLSRFSELARRSSTAFSDIELAISETFRGHFYLIFFRYI